ncbi:hypothetical protein B0T16DRAFT_60051 [Cercophora newfieldiana]|uniref:Uncharacterized protein n=1 Tax=Cercophora newfieldiana TaxID=92897 RepID=A0AA39YTZ5_9PEZI|nr:hypothetical protein B0T16DRAFT_60051 [Cercophora newfieldiana]
MDSMMFSPYGYGPLPPSAMAEIERKTAAALQSGSLRKLLELDKKDKEEPLQSAPASPPSSPPPDGSRQDRSIQVRRADSISQQQNNLMLKAARRSVILPSLSIAIPPSPSGERRQEPRDKQPAEPETERGNERSSDHGIEADADPLHKQVKFLAPDDGEMSDQSSICQSPSWEGYGQRKKEKKKEAERRKREKEQAEKEARAAKRRHATRLSKSPPPKVNGRASRAAGVLSNADRSLSDPMLISQHLLPENPSSVRLDDIGRAASADDLQRFRDQQPAMAEVLSDSETRNRRFTGGVKLERERESVLQTHLAAQGQHPASFHGHPVGNDGAYQQNPHSPPLDGSMAYVGHPTGQPAMTKQENRPSREAFPPSASRTPMLRHMPPPGLSRHNSFLQGASKIFRGRDGKASGETESDRGRHRDGYVQRHREQSSERSVAEIAYEQLINNGSYHSSSTRSSSRDTRHTRRSSFTQEARSVAMKIAGIKLTPSARDESVDSGRASSQTDYFNHSAEQSYSNGPVSATNHESYRNCFAEEQLAMSEAALSRGTLALRDGAERPPTSRSSASSSSPSVGGTAFRDHAAKKGRSFRDVAKAALGSSRGPHAASDGPQSQMLVVPYATLRSHVDTPNSSPEAIYPPLRSPKSVLPTATALQERNPEATQNIPNQLEHSVVKPTEVDHVGSRVSEGSSSSSAYEDGSPPPSPVTTPDTSRPQSSKDVPYTMAELPKKPEESQHTRDDDVTLQASEGSNGSSTSTTPRQVNHEAIEGADLPNEDRFSRTAMPLDIDCDAQSFTTSFSNLDGIDNIDETLANAAAAAQQSRHKDGEDGQAIREPKRLRSLSDTNHRSGNVDSAILPASFTQFDVGPSLEPQISIPPRSKKREAARRPSTSHGDTVTTERRREHAPDSPPQQTEPEWGSVKTGKGSVRETADFDKSAEWAMLSNTGAFGSPEDGQALPIKDTSFLISRSSTPEMDPPHISPTLPPHDKEPINSHVPAKTQNTESRASGRTSTSPPSPESPKFPRPNSPSVKHAQRAQAPPRMASAPTPMSKPSSTLSSSRSATSMAPATGPSPAHSVTRPAGATPVSILKQPARSTSDSAAVVSPSSSRPPVLSALPKHMQLQAGMPSRPPVAAPEARMAPIAKMFVECCNCKFYHDMPSKLYECMAKPDAVVEDRLLGISGAITTMVKCPWCQHNMSTSCCAGYAAVVYLKEKLH